MNGARKSSALVDRYCILQERDQELLVDVFLQRLMSRDQIIALGYFGSVPRCNNRLGILVTHRYLRRYQHSSRGSASQSLYCLGPTAAELVSDSLEVPIKDVRRQVNRPAPTSCLEHTLGLVDLRILFTKAARAEGVSRFQWLAEPMCRHEYSLRAAKGWERHILKPDALCLWGDRVAAVPNFIELDLGHVSRAAFSRKIDSYRRYLDFGVFKETYGASSFQVLTVTTGSLRLASLAKLAAPQAQPVFLFTTLDELKRSAPSSLIWTDGSERRCAFGGFR